MKDPMVSMLSSGETLLTENDINLPWYGDSRRGEIGEHMARISAGHLFGRIANGDRIRWFARVVHAVHENA